MYLALFRANSPKGQTRAYSERSIGLITGHLGHEAQGSVGSKSYLGKKEARWRGKPAFLLQLDDHQDLVEPTFFPMTSGGIKYAICSISTEYIVNPI